MASSLTPPVTPLLWFCLVVTSSVFSMPHVSSGSSAKTAVDQRGRGHSPPAWLEAVGRSILEDGDIGDNHRLSTDIKRMSSSGDPGEYPELGGMVSTADDLRMSHFAPMMSYRLPHSPDDDVIDGTGKGKSLRRPLSVHGGHNQQKQRQRGTYGKAWIDEIAKDGATILDVNANGALAGSRNGASRHGDVGDATLQLPQPLESDISDSDRRLFELLISALNDDSLGDESKRNHHRGALSGRLGGGRRKSPSKPCYWSLVSCY